MVIKLTDRLAGLASYVTHGAAAADIGTDHALLPAYLVQQGICRRVIASDLHPGPLEAARTTIEVYKLKEAVDLREGNGLSVLQPGEADLLIIAGMGGVKIKEIIESRPDVLHLVKRLVLQPLGGLVALRSWLVENGWRIVDEDLILEDNRYYLIIVAEPKQDDDRESCHQGADILTQEYLMEIGPKLLEKRHRLLIPYLTKQLEDMTTVAKALDRARTPAAKEMQQNWYQKIAVYRKVITCLSAEK